MSGVLSLRVMRARGEGGAWGKVLACFRAAPHTAKTCQKNGAPEQVPAASLEGLRASGQREGAKRAARAVQLHKYVSVGASAQRLACSERLWQQGVVR
jgi:hypothetical protein